jgi:ATP-binding cassette subfamily B protein/subfamily B ATP-binding cassette protein MsbA
VRTLRRLLPYLKAHPREIAIMLGAMVAAVAFDLLRPWPMKLLIDHVLGGQPLSPGFAALVAALPGAQSTNGLLAWASVATVVIFLGGSALATVSLVTSVRLGQRMVYALGADLFAHVQRLSLAFHSRRPVGDSVARVTGDPYCLQMLVNGTVLPVAQSLLTLGAMFVVMWRLEPSLTLLALGVVPFLGLFIYGFGRPMHVWARERRDREAHLMAGVQQTLTAMPAVQAFGREDTESARFRRQAAATIAAYERSSLADMGFKLAVGLVTAIGTASIMWVGGRYALEGAVTAGTILVFLSYLAALYTPLNEIAHTASTVQYAVANAERVVDLLDTAPDVIDHPGAAQVRLIGHVRYDDVTFGYEARRPVVRGLTLDVKPGEVVAIVGATGAGKSTLVSLLLRCFDPWSGRIMIDGHDVRSLSVKSLRAQVAIVLQESFILPITVAENIAYGRPDATREQIEAAAAAANAADFIGRLPHGYATGIGERGMTLSIGEQQRLAIARAFVKDAPILVLDEPTSALDAHTESAVLDALQRLVKGRTTFIVAHRLSTVRHADRVVVLDDGALLEDGPPAELLRRDGGPFARLWARQLGGTATPV